jgi:hypothetical protein
VIATSAREVEGSQAVTFSELRRSGAADDRPVLLLFGTGWGLANRAFALVDHRLPPIRGRSEFNHLSVRSAVAIVLDRLFGLRPLTQV